VFGLRQCATACFVVWICADGKFESCWGRKVGRDMLRGEVSLGSRRRGGEGGGGGDGGG
jgi:hypothetical protein